MSLESFFDTTLNTLDKSLVLRDKYYQTEAARQDAALIPATQPTQVNTPAPETFSASLMDRLKTPVGMMLALAAVVLTVILAVRLTRGKK